MPDKYKQAITNAMRGKCIPYKKETKATLNEMYDNARRYTNIKKVLQAQKRCNHYTPPRRGSGRDISEAMIEIANFLDVNPKEVISTIVIADIINKPESEESSNANSTE